MYRIRKSDKLCYQHSDQPPGRIPVHFLYDVYTHDGHFEGLLVLLDLLVLGPLRI